MERGIPAHVGRLIVSQIAAFETACAHTEYTDTDEAWAVLNTIKQELQTAMHPEPLDVPELTVKVGALEPNVEEEAGQQLPGLAGDQRRAAPSDALSRARRAL